VPVVADDSPLSFPCDFPIKVMGRKQPRFVNTVTEIVRKHAPDFDAATVALRPSRHGKYLSVTCVVRATSRQQLDALYQELCDHPAVARVL
jgi:putative lipoic acid-binding regulatory protein